MSNIAQPSIRRANRADVPAALALLRAAGLPTDDISAGDTVQMWVLEGEHGIVGAVALEGVGSAGRLLRSLVIDPTLQHRGLGRALVAHVERAARAEGVAQLVLLTETARGLFERLGYEQIQRSSAPVDLKSSAEFRLLCPASAVCMVKQLDAAQ